MFACSDNVIKVEDMLCKLPALPDEPRLYFKVVGDYTSEGFAKNYGGHPRSDVALLDESDNMMALTQVLNRMDQRKSDGVSADVSDSELSLAFKSKYCQTASEYAKYYEHLLEIRDHRELEKLEGDERVKRDAELKSRRDALRQTLNADEKEYLRKKQREREIESLID